MLVTMPSENFEKPWIIQANYCSYLRDTEYLKKNYIEYPRSISIETQVKCNATCDFCAYPNSTRKGMEMPDQLFYKIVDDLSVIPKNHSVAITLCRINEPLLDKRLKQFSKLISENIPSAVQSFWSNGSMLKPGKFEWISEYKGGNLYISLNSLDDSEHKKIMGFGVEQVLSNLEYLHNLVVRREFSLTVMLFAPYQNMKQADLLIKTCNERWPSFSIGIRPFFRWVGETRAGESQLRNSAREGEINMSEAEKFPCAQWFDLNILANGFVTRCCIDETGYVGQNKYDVSVNNVLHIYNYSRNLRNSLPERRNVDVCKDCWFLG